MGSPRGYSGSLVFVYFSRDVNEAERPRPGRSRPRPGPPEARSWGHIPIFRLKSQNIKLLCNVHAMNDN